MNHTIAPTLTANEVNRIAIPVADIADIVDAGIYPLTINAISIYFNDAVNTVGHLEMPHIYGVHTAIDPDAGVEQITIDNTSHSLFAYPNPVKRGETITLNIDNNSSYAIYSVSGVLINKGCGNKVDTSSLPLGVYFISSNNLTTKIIIK